MNENLLVGAIFGSLSALSSPEKYVLMILSATIKNGESGVSEKNIEDLSTKFGMDSKLVQEVLKSLKFKQILYKSNDKNISGFGWFINHEVVRLLDKYVKIKQMRTRYAGKSENNAENQNYFCGKSCGKLVDCCGKLVNNLFKSHNGDIINSACLFSRMDDPNMPKKSIKLDFFLQNFLKNSKFIQKKCSDAHNKSACAPACVCTCARAEIYNIYERYTCISRREQYKKEVNFLINNYYCKKKEAREGFGSWCVKKDNTRKKKSKKHFDICSEILLYGVWVEGEDHIGSSLRELLGLRDGAKFMRQADGSVVIENKAFRDSSNFGTFWETYPAAYRKLKPATLRLYATITQKTSPRSILEALRAQKKQKEIEISLGLPSSSFPSPLAWLQTGMWLEPIKTEKELSIRRKKQAIKLSKIKSSEKMDAAKLQLLMEVVLKKQSIRDKAVRSRD